MLAITGASGFIGSNLLKSTHFDSAAWNLRDKFASPPSGSKVVVHCANVAGNPSLNLHLTKEVIESAKKHNIQKVILFGSFATLWGKGSADINMLNCGFSPPVIDPYTHGKLSQEVLLQKVGADGTLSIDLLYLPVVFGRGGVWHRNITRGPDSGSLRLPTSNALNFCHVSDVSLAVEYLCNNATHQPSLRRHILNSPHSSELTWARLVADIGSYGYSEEEPRSLDKVKLFLSRQRIVRAMRAAARGSRRSRASGLSMDPEVGAFAFSPYYFALMHHQIYIKPTILAKTPYDQIVSELRKAALEVRHGK